MNTSTPARSVITDNCPPVRRNHLPSHFDKLESVFREAYLTAEYSHLSIQPKLAGVYVIPSYQSPNLWFGVIFIHHGLYQGGVFRFTLRFPDPGFPENGQLPIVLFHPPIFHPQIHPSKGQLELKRYFRSGWIKNSHHVCQILQIVKRIFYKIDTSHPIDKTAAEMYELHAENYVAKAKQEVELSLSKVYDDPPDGFKNDPHYIRFSEKIANFDMAALQSTLQQQLVSKSSQNLVHDDDSSSPVSSKSTTPQPDVNMSPSTFKFDPSLHGGKLLQPSYKYALFNTHGREEAAKKKGLSFMDR